MFLKNLSFSSNSSISSYETDSSGSEKYPKMKDNTEYYLYNSQRKPIFAKNNENDEIYAKDFISNDVYPKRAPFFAKDRHNNFYYARDCELNEFYPLYKNLSVTINRNGEMLIARLSSGCQRYPTDSHGNCYYPKNKEGKPFYLRDENGFIYPAKTKKNEYIYLEPPILDKKHVRKKKDALKNTVYTCSPKIYNWRVSFDVLCLLTIIMSPLIIFASIMAA